MLKTATTEVDDLERTLGWVLEQHVLGLQVTMHDAVVSHQRQRSKHLGRKAADESGSEPFKSIRLDELIEIDAK